MSDAEIRELFRNLIDVPVQVVPGRVLSVDEDKLTCIVKPIGGDPEIKARLKSAVDEKEGYFLLIPEVDSSVLVGLINNDETKSFVLSFGQLSKLHVLIGSQRLVMNSEGWVFNEGNNGGLTITPKLVQELEKTNQLIQAILTVINGASIPEPGNGSPSALQVALKSAIVGKSLGNYSSIENDEIKH